MWATWALPLTAGARICSVGEGLRSQPRRPKLDPVHLRGVHCRASPRRAASGRDGPLRPRQRQSPPRQRRSNGKDSGGRGPKPGKPPTGLDSAFAFSAEQLLAFERKGHTCVRGFLQSGEVENFRCFPEWPDAVMVF